MDKIRKIYNMNLQGELLSDIAEEMIEDILESSVFTFSGEKCDLIKLSLVQDEIIIEVNNMIINLPFKQFLDFSEMIKMNKLYDKINLS